MFENNHLYFDPRIREVVPHTNSSGVMLNDKFMPWEKRIESVLDIPNIDANIRLTKANHGKVVESLFLKYYYDPDKTLFENCKRHADDYEKPIESDTLFTLVHPFYMHLCNMRRVEEYSLQEDADRYLDRLKSFLSKLEKIPSRSDSLGVVLFDTAHHYAAVTSRLVEEGLVDKVIFTEFGVGNPKDLNELQLLKDKTIYVAGGYNNKCLLGAIYDLSRKVKDPRKIFALRDLILDSPSPKAISLLDPKWIGVTEKTNLPLDQVTTSHEMFERISLERRIATTSFSNTVQYETCQL